MAAKASTIWYVDAPDPHAVLREHPESDHDAAQALAGRLFPDRVAVPTSSAPISAGAGVVANEIFIGCYPGVTVVCSPQLALPRPSEIPGGWIRPLASEQTFLIAFDARHEWGAFAIWERGALRRSFSATKVHIHEDLGLPLVWERPFWAGEFPIAHPPGVLPDPQSLPFDPQQFADAANRKWLTFGYQGDRTGALEPSAIVVTGFALYKEGEVPTATPARHQQQQQQHVGTDEGRAAKRKWLRRKNS
ncbi:DUF6928 family protein [Antrihabitans cavernicola]|uniref:Uncharacterized protein n=1 Tax=Antrihabitans cavernicola TaxID=2495913 RepID=A0A5A7S9I2_9NOCA|nr:hypothetical protein [Spelaeibacter cavernicola]KAA0021205.1 hypothetical protein FOY51_20055 [Spelaeibacter cavernicola]